MQLEEWRRVQAAGEEATLPSGLEIRVKRVGVMDLAERGEIPQVLQPQIEKLMSSSQQGQIRVVKLAEFKEFAGVINLVCEACIVAPVELTVTELPMFDRLSVFTWANEPGEKLKPFRREQTGDVEAPFVSGELRRKAK